MWEEIRVPRQNPQQHGIKCKLQAEMHCLISVTSSRWFGPCCYESVVPAAGEIEKAHTTVTRLKTNLNKLCASMNKWQTKLDLSLGITKQLDGARNQERSINLVRFFSFPNTQLIIALLQTGVFVGLEEILHFFIFQN